MKKNILLFILLAIVSSCGGGGDGGGGESPAVNKDYLSVTPNLELLADGQTTEITISSNCSWTISKDADWLTVSPMEGTNTQKVTISAMMNSTGENRMAILSVKGGSLPARTVTVTQLKKVEIMTLTVNKSSLVFEKNGGTQSFTITSNTDWSITYPDWCSLSTSAGKGNATISVTATENPAKNQRSGQIVINGDGVSSVIMDVTQQPGDKDSHEPNTGDNLPPS